MIGSLSAVEFLRLILHRVSACGKAMITAPKCVSLIYHLIQLPAGSTCRNLEPNSDPCCSLDRTQRAWQSAASQLCPIPRQHPRPSRSPAASLPYTANEQRSPLRLAPRQHGDSSARVRSGAPAKSSTHSMLLHSS